MADEVLDLVAHVLHRPIRVDLAAEDDAWDVPDESAEALLAVGERSLGRLAVSDVEQEALRLHGRPLLVGDDDDLVLHPDNAPVAPHETILSREGLPLRVALAMLHPHALRVVL